MPWQKWKTFNWSCLSVCRKEVKTNTPLLAALFPVIWLYPPGHIIFSSFIWLISRTIEAEPRLYLNCSQKFFSDEWTLFYSARSFSNKQWTKEGVLTEKNKTKNEKHEDLWNVWVWRERIAIIAPIKNVREFLNSLNTLKFLNAVLASRAGVDWIKLHYWFPKTLLVSFPFKHITRSLSVIYNALKTIDFI